MMADAIYIDDAGEHAARIVGRRQPNAELEIYKSVMANPQDQQMIKLRLAVTEGNFAILGSPVDCGNQWKIKVRLVELMPQKK